MDSSPGRGRPKATLHDEPARWVTSSRFLLRSLNLRGPAFLLALLAVTVGAAVIATALNLRVGLSEKMSHQLRSYGPNLLVRPRPPDSTLDETIAARLPALLGDQARTAPVLLAGGSVRGRGATIVGTDLAGLLRLDPAFRLSPADSLTADGTAACLVGGSLAARAELRPGDAVDLEAGGVARLRVAGIVTTGESEDDQLFVLLPVLQDLTGLRGRLSYFAVSIDGGIHAVEAASAKAEAAFPGVLAHPLRAIARAEGAILRRTDRMMVLLTLVILVLSGLCLVTTLMSMVVERESEIGLARAIGAGDSEIYRMFLGEVGILGTLGAFAGAALGALLVRVIGVRLFGTSIEPSLAVVPVVILTSLLICLIAVYVPLRRALRIQPAAALRGE